VIEAEIQKVADFGLVVLLGGKVRAICPLMHLFESSGSAPQMTKKFKPKQKLSLRVWEARDGSVVMTNKKSIVQAEDQYLLRSLEEAVEGKVALGVVSRISQSGLQVHFFNGVKGLVPMSVLVKQGVTGESPS
jgi:ribosomal protein S1